MKEEESPKSQRATVGVSSSPWPQHAAERAAAAEAAGAAAAAAGTAAAPAAPSSPPPPPPPATAATTPPPAESPAAPLTLDSPFSSLFLARGSLGARSSTFASLRSRCTITGLLPCRYASASAICCAQQAACAWE